MRGPGQKYNGIVRENQSEQLVVGISFHAVGLYSSEDSITIRADQLPAIELFEIAVMATYLLDLCLTGEITVWTRAHG